MEYTVQITEHLIRDVRIEAESASEAMEKVREKWRSCDIILDDGDFKHVEFRAL